MYYCNACFIVVQEATMAQNPSTISTFLLYTRVLYTRKNAGSMLEIPGRFVFRSWDKQSVEIVLFFAEWLGFNASDTILLIWGGQKGTQSSAAHDTQFCYKYQKIPFLARAQESFILTRSRGFEMVIDSLFADEFFCLTWYKKGKAENGFSHKVVFTSRNRAVGEVEVCYFRDKDHIIQWCSRRSFTIWEDSNAKCILRTKLLRT